VENGYAALDSAAKETAEGEGDRDASGAAFHYLRGFDVRARSSRSVVHAIDCKPAKIVWDRPIGDGGGTAAVPATATVVTTNGEMRFGAVTA